MLSAIPVRQPETTVTVKRNLHDSPCDWDSTSPFTDDSGISCWGPASVFAQDIYAEGEGRSKRKESGGRGGSASGYCRQ